VDAGANRGDAPLNTPNNMPDNLGLDINQYSGKTTTDAGQNCAQVDSQKPLTKVLVETMKKMEIKTVYQIPGAKDLMIFLYLWE